MGSGVVSISVFFGRPGFFLGFAGCPVVTRIRSCIAAFLIFLGLPGLRLTGLEGSIEALEEAIGRIGLVEFVFVADIVFAELVDALSSLTFLGLPGRRFTGCASTSVGADFGLPLFTSVKSGLTR